MVESRFRTQRCRHNIAVGLCEDRTCPGWDAARASKAAVTRLHAPRCSKCGRRRGDAVVRELPPGSTAQRPKRLCDDCVGDQEVRAEADAVRAKFVTPYRPDTPRRRQGASQ